MKNRKGLSKMRCPRCDANVSDTATLCTFCGQNLSVIHYIRRVSNTYYNLGLEKAKVRDLSGAIVVLKKSLEFNKKNTNARNLLGLIYYEMGETVAALSEWVLSKYLQADDNAADYYINTIQKNQTALDATNQTIKKYNSALAAAQAGNDDLAIIQLKKVVSLNPHFVRAQQLLALLYIHDKDYHKAAKCLNRARRIDFNNTTTLRYMQEVGDLAASSEKELVKKQLALTYKQYQRDSILHQKGAVSGKDLETTNNLYIGGQLSMENMLSTLENLSMQLAQMKEELLDTEYQYIDKESTLITQLKSLTIQLLTEIQAWEINYVLITPIPGKVTFTNYWIENQNILSGDIAFSVIPSSNNKLIGKALLPTERSGKVKVGQKVNIKFSNYPDNEFGIVRGIVRNISLISVKVETKNHYVVEVELPEGLTTTYGKKLPFVSEMEGQADIITDDLSLLERILLPIKKILTESL